MGEATDTMYNLNSFDSVYTGWSNADKDKADNVSGIEWEPGDGTVLTTTPRLPAQAFAAFVGVAAFFPQSIRVVPFPVEE